jgi:hypothetical protein
MSFGRVVAIKMAGSSDSDGSDGSGDSDGSDDSDDSDNGQASTDADDELSVEWYLLAGRPLEQKYTGT